MLVNINLGRLASYQSAIILGCHEQTVAYALHIKHDLVGQLFAHNPLQSRNHHFIIAMLDFYRAAADTGDERPLNMQYRSLVKVIVLSLLTLGVYQLYWLYATRKELTQKGYQVPPLFQLFGPVIFLFLAIVITGFLSDGSSASVSSKPEFAYGLMLIVLLVASLAIIPVALYWFYKYCKAVEAVTGGRTSFGLVYALLIAFALLGVGIVWPLIIQDGFNKVADAEPKPDSPHHDVT